MAASVGALKVRWIERYLSVWGGTVGALHDRWDKSLLEESMDDVMALLASSSERFYQLRSRRHQRRQREAAWERLGQVRVDAQRLNVGQAARLLGVTAKVKHVGGRADRYQLVERNYSPAYLLPLPDNRAAAAGAIVQALQAEGPLLLVQYWLASGQPKITWIDMLRLEDTGRS